MLSINCTHLATFRHSLAGWIWCVNSEGGNMLRRSKCRHTRKINKYIWSFCTYYNFIHVIIFRCNSESAIIICPAQYHPLLLRPLYIYNNTHSNHSAPLWHRTTTAASNLLINNNGELNTSIIQLRHITFFFFSSATGCCVCPLPARAPNRHDHVARKASCSLNSRWLLPLLSSSMCDEYIRRHLCRRRRRRRRHGRMTSTSVVVVRAAECESVGCLQLIWIRDWLLEPSSSPQFTSTDWGTRHTDTGTGGGQFFVVVVVLVRPEKDTDWDDDVGRSVVRREET